MILSSSTEYDTYIRTSHNSATATVFWQKSDWGYHTCKAKLLQPSQLEGCEEANSPQFKHTHTVLVLE